MIRKIIKINEERCNGCGLCARACHEGAIGIVDGTAKLLREDYCDGLGDCLPACPMRAITFEEREAPAYDEAAVLAAKAAKAVKEEHTEQSPCRCPGSACQTINHEQHENIQYVPSELTNFPVQIKLAPPRASYFDGADLLIAADCTAYAYGNFHTEFIKNRVTLIGCPKLDAVDYAEKLTQIFKYNNIQSVTVTRMTVPCCGGLSYAVKKAVESCGKHIPLQVVMITPDGKIPE